MLLCESCASYAVECAEILLEAVRRLSDSEPVRAAVDACHGMVLHPDGVLLLHVHPEAAFPGLDAELLEVLPRSVRVVVIECDGCGEPTPETIH